MFFCRQLLTVPSLPPPITSPVSSSPHPLPLPQNHRTVVCVHGFFLFVHTDLSFVGFLTVSSITIYIMFS